MAKTSARSALQMFWAEMTGTCFLTATIKIVSSTSATPDGKTNFAPFAIGIYCNFVHFCSLNFGKNAFLKNVYTVFGLIVRKGFVLMIMVYTFGYISGGHFNPSVTTGFIFRNPNGWRSVWKVLMYYLAEVTGAIMGGFFAWGIGTQYHSLSLFCLTL